MRTHLPTPKLDNNAVSNPKPKFSIVIPVKNEAGNIDLLVDEIDKHCAAIGPFELIFIDDGSSDETAKAVLARAKQYNWVRLVSHPKSAGQSAAIHSGVGFARADIICMLDGDGQNPPLEIPNLVAPFLTKECPPDLGLVAGQRTKRKDTLSKRLASRAANAIRAWMLKDGTRDTGCGLKAFRRGAFLGLPFFNHMHRYLPALFSRDGWQIRHVDVSHAERHAGASNYNNLNRALVGIYDLLGVAWLLKRAKQSQPVERKNESQQR